MTTITMIIVSRDNIIRGKGNLSHILKVQNKKETNNKKGGKKERIVLKK